MFPFFILLTVLFMKLLMILTELAPAMFHLLQTAFLQGDHA